MILTLLLSRIASCWNETSRQRSDRCHGRAKCFHRRIWPIMPTCVRITVGTHDEMQKSRARCKKAMRGTTAFSLQPVVWLVVRGAAGMVCVVRIFGSLKLLGERALTVVGCPHRHGRM